MLSVKGASLVAICAWALTPGPVGTADPGAAGDVPELTDYQFVILRPGDPAEPANDHRSSRLRNAHDHWVRNLIRDDVALLAGPVVGAGSAERPIEQAAIMKMPSTGDVVSAFQGSSAVELGWLEPEVYPLWGPKDVLRKPEDPARLVDCILGLFRRPVEAPELPEERLVELQRGHLANIRAMTEAGDLVFAGPLDQAGDLRGILVFRTTDVRRIRELLAADPAVAAGRLEVELLRWKVARGSFPPRPARADSEPAGSPGE